MPKKNWGSGARRQRLGTGEYFGTKKTLATEAVRIRTGVDPVRKARVTAAEARINRQVERMVNRGVMSSEKKFDAIRESDKVKGISQMNSGAARVAVRAMNPPKMVTSIENEAKALAGGLSRSELRAARMSGIDPMRVLEMKNRTATPLVKVGPGVSDEQAARGKKFDAISDQERNYQRATGKRMPVNFKAAAEFGAAGVVHGDMDKNPEINAARKSAKKLDAARWDPADSNRQSEDPDAPQYSNAKRSLSNYHTSGESQFTSRGSGGGGGKGRGNWGHKGRPGKRGGSA